MSKVINDYKIDHLVVGANKLEEGSKYIEDLLGVKLGRIGKHKKFGTHNRVLNLSGLYLEVIAIDNESEVKANNCWFGLDDPFVKNTVLKTPKLISFVISSRQNENLTTHQKPIFVERDNFSWNFRRPKKEFINKALFPYGDVFPSIISWLSDSPLEKMEKNHLSFESLDIELNQKQNSFKEFLLNFNLNENINFFQKNKLNINLLPNLSANILNTYNGETIKIT